MLPEADHVAEQAKRHVRVGPALVLEQDVDPNRYATDRDAIHEVTEARAELGVDVAAGLDLQRGEVEALAQRPRQHGTQLGNGVVAVRERRLEERVVRRRGHRGEGTAAES
jgi:pyridoxine 5'-phosphate synthase PdxJ